MKDIDPALYKLPPQNIEAEQSILGSVLLENHAINAAQEIINENDFTMKHIGKFLLSSPNLPTKRAC